MKKTTRTVLIFALAAVTILCLASAVWITHQKNARELPNPNVTLVAAPEQTEFEELSDWTLPEPEEIDYGENLALNKPITQNGNTQIYQCRNAVDGDRFTYWEGVQDEYPNIITVDLEQPESISGFGILLNPRQIWSARTQEVEIQISDDGESFAVLLPAQTVSFDPLADNRCYLPLEAPVTAQYVRFVFTANSGARAGQAAEVEIYREEG